MKNLLKFLGVMVLGLMVFTACSKDDDPANNDLFAGTYKGKVTFKSGDQTKSNDDGSVFVTKVGDSYNFAFSDGIEDINNIKFDKEDENTYINIGGNATSYIRINESKLNILYLKDGKIWTANCTR